MTDYKKLYEEALERAKEMSALPDDRATMEYIFPELKESEDDKMLNQLHEWMKEFGGAEEYTEKVYCWLKGLLEKQGEKLPVGFYYVDSNGNKYFSDTFKNGDFTFHVEKGEQIHANFAKTCKDEQKNADKVEPKFKVGDWVKSISSGNIFKILSVNDGLYRVLCYDGVEANYPIEVEKDLAYWTIEDANDGDMIATNYFIFIFKNIDSNNGVHYYCQYEIIKYEDDNQFDTALPESLMGKVGSTNYSPATKEQRDTLMKAMTDAGYTFDFEKKELKKIEQKPAWSEEEDETVLNNLIYALANDIIGNCSDEYVDWLKSLKGRILKFEK